MTIATPALRPACPHFSSGPCAKRPGWSLQALADAVLGRSHRSKLGKAKLKRAIDLTRNVLQVPGSHRIAIVPASDTGAVEMALWSLLGARPVTMLAWESFGEGWVTDVVKQLKLKDVTLLKAGYGELPDLSKVDPASDVVFTWNGTTSGVRVPNADWIAADRTGLTICDATSAAFAQPLDFPGQHGHGARPEQRPQRHLDCAGIGGRHDADAVARRHLQHVAREIDGALELGLAKLGAMRASEDGVGEGLQAPAGALGAGAGGAMRASGPDLRHPALGHRN